MRGSQIKKIRRWCKASWEATPAEEQANFGTLEKYIECMKNECVKNPDAKKFVDWSLKEHFSGVVK
jgi:hypothetical protein